MNNLNLEHTNLVIEALTKYKEDAKAISKKRKIQEVIDIYKEHGNDLEFEERINLLDYNILHDVTSRLISETVKKREDQILKLLEDNGYKFENRVELEEFAKKRCKILTFQDSPKRILTVDGKQICEWWETSRFENDGNKFTCIIGEPPSTRFPRNQITDSESECEDCGRILRNGDVCKGFYCEYIN